MVSQKTPLGEFQIITNKQEERPHQIDEPKSLEPELKKTQNNNPNQLRIKDKLTATHKAKSTKLITQVPKSIWCYTVSPN